MIHFNISKPFSRTGGCCYAWKVMLRRHRALLLELLAAKREIKTLRAQLDGA